jgi:ankyrin repeat protein
MILTIDETDFLNACYDGNLAKLKTLLPLIDNVHIRDKEGNTPLWYAVIQEHHEVIDFLMDNGANINETDSDENTLLDGVENIEMLNKLISYGIDIHIFENKPESPLYYLILYGRLNIAKKLIELGVQYEHINLDINQYQIQEAYIEEMKEFFAIFKEKKKLESSSFNEGQKNSKEKKKL